MSSVMEQCIRAIRLEQKLGGYQRITAATPWNERFAMFRRNYRLKQKLVDAGVDSWMDGDPYELADWISLFTPIERSLWTDIRSAGLALWPQLPVGRFFVDFGNPVARIAIECDGKDFHNAAKDEARDAELGAIGWVVERIPGWMCHGVAPEYDPEADKEEREARRIQIETKTPARVIRRVADRLSDYATRSAE